MYQNIIIRTIHIYSQSTHTFLFSFIQTSGRRQFEVFSFFSLQFSLLTHIRDVVLLANRSLISSFYSNILEYDNGSENYQTHMASIWSYMVNLLNTYYFCKKKKYNLRKTPKERLLILWSIINGFVLFFFCHAQTRSYLI